MKKYRKKPVVIEAVEFNKKKWEVEISQGKLSESFPMVLLSVISGFSPVIETLEGDMKVSDGDFIIKGIQGEYYPCKPDIFHDSYEKVDDEAKLPMMKPKFIGKTKREGKEVEGHLFYFDDGRRYITPTGSDVYGFAGNEADKQTVMFSVYEVWPESVALKQSY